MSLCGGGSKYGTGPEAPLRELVDVAERPHLDGIQHLAQIEVLAEPLEPDHGQVLEVEQCPHVAEQAGITRQRKTFAGQPHRLVGQHADHLVLAAPLPVDAPLPALAASAMAEELRASSRRRRPAAPARWPAAEPVRAGCSAWPSRPGSARRDASFGVGDAVRRMRPLWLPPCRNLRSCRSVPAFVLPPVWIRISSSAYGRCDAAFEDLAGRKGDPVANVLRRTHHGQAAPRRPSTASNVLRDGAWAGVADPELVLRFMKGW